ncbi:MAG: metal-dependent transcriptional regulator [Treponemataceae bacterium]
MTKSLEDYLETIGDIISKNEKPRVKDIALQLNISKPSVHTALHALEEHGMIIHEHYGSIMLTAVGDAYFKEIRHKHNTISSYLQKKLNISLETAEKDACAMEHILSTETLEKMALQLQQD